MKKEISNNNKTSQKYYIEWIFVLIVTLISVVFIEYLQVPNISSIQNNRVLGARADDLSDYQAIFLDNNQVYFGKVESIGKVFLYLGDVYYLQANREGQNLEEYSNPNENLSLVALGSEVHGPTNQMKINLEHVLFIENLKKDSKVVNAIISQK